MIRISNFSFFRFGWKKTKIRLAEVCTDPISLISVDYKIGSRALGTRLAKVLPDMIHENQCAYVKGRIIFDAVRSINDVMEYTKLHNIPGLITTFHFKNLLIH